MPIFTFPLAFVGLLAAPALIAIYWLRNRAREHQVSSLLLWLDEKQMWEGGRRIHRLQTPLLFFLELLTILLLVTAAAGPMIRAGDSRRPLVIVLDDSFSMLAGNEDSARSRAARALENELSSNRYDPVRFVLAGETPQVLGETTGRAEQAVKYLNNWKCGALTSKLDEAVAFAFELGGSRARVLAVTDHAPSQEPADSRLQWWAFGASRPNTAFVNAARDNEDRVLLEIANLSTSSNSTILTLESTNTSSSDSTNPQSAIRNPQSIAFAANETRRIVLTLKAGSPPLRARLSDDALKIDNDLVLMPEADKIVRVDLRLRNESLRALVERALQSSRNTLITADKPELVITDDAEAKVVSPETWTLQLISEKDAASFLGPFVIDRAHPLTEGLSLGGVVWGGGKGAQFPGTPMITAGDIPLLTDLERADKHELRLRLRPDLSTLQETPNWPILIWNLINWRAVSAPGLQQTNVRLGADATLKVESGVETVKVTDPQQRSIQLPSRESSVIVKAETIGVYEIGANEKKYSFASNALQRKESDLTNAASGRWGNWAKATDLQWEYRSVAWAPMLLAMIVLAIHAWLVTRN